jgi:hypothetical protein
MMHVMVADKELGAAKMSAVGAVTLIEWINISKVAGHNFKLHFYTATKLVVRRLKNEQTELCAGAACDRA